MLFFRGLVLLLRHRPLQRFLLFRFFGSRTLFADEERYEAGRQHVKIHVCVNLSYFYLSVFQQFVGINVVLYYAPEIFRNMGMGTNAALAQTIIVGVINLSFTVLAIFTVDRFGRKPLMIIGSLGMAVSMVTLGLTFYTQHMGWLSLAAMLCYTASFAMSWGPVCWVLLSEIFPNRIRGQAMALAVAAQWVANYVVSWTFPMMDKSSYLIEHFHHGFAYWIYALMGLASAFFMVKFVPETKGKSLEEMEKLFKK